MKSNTNLKTEVEWNSDTTQKKVNFIFLDTVNNPNHNKKATIKTKTKNKILQFEKLFTQKNPRPQLP